MLVPGHVRIELGLPALGIRCRRGGKMAAWMTVPVAAMDENHDLELRQYDIRAAWQTANAQPVTKSSRVQKPSHHELGLGILPPDARHHSGAGLYIYDIHGSMFSGSQTHNNGVPRDRPYH